MLPPAVRAALAARLEGVSRRDLARRATRISTAYRAGGRSAGAIRDPLDALAYAVVRMPATHAAVGAALARLAERWPGFAPVTMLDLGAGPGTATMAAHQLWSTLAEATLVEPDPRFRELGAALLGPAAGLTARWLAATATAGGGETPGKAGLVVAAYLLVELDEAAARRLALAAFAALDAASGALVLVEPGTPAGFARIRAAREALIAIGARIVAPCPGEGACPMAGGDWCHFSVRLARSRDHKLVKGADVPFEDERFTYLIVTRGDCAPAAAARILAEPAVERGGITLKLCTAAGLAARRIARADKAAHQAARRLGWGDEA